MTTTEETKMTVARKNHHGKTPTGYALRRKRIEAAGTGRVTTWRGRPCIGGGCAGHAEPITPAWDAAPIPVQKCRNLRKAKGGAE